jgi:hypothetical protein
MERTMSRKTLLIAAAALSISAGSAFAASQGNTEASNIYGTYNAPAGQYNPPVQYQQYRGQSAGDTTAPSNNWMYQNNNGAGAGGDPG